MSMLINPYVFAAVVPSVVIRTAAIVGFMGMTVAMVTISTSAY